MKNKVRTSKWEPEARTEPAPKTEPAARTEPAPRTEPAARTEPENDKRQSIKCPSCGYLLLYIKGTEKRSITCTRCGKVFQAE